ncbi:MAG: hypothetical protein HC903_07140 [Methylacidiphilales bacterium]|nr:hypothetical protein [Candidatus Methylacidiphilales bacterium]NJR17588.1 hypothetical protein [Calothrix sp. CSU_2_0]
MKLQQAGWIQEKHVLVANSAANSASEDKMFKFEFLEKAKKGNCELSNNCQQVIRIVDVPSIGKTLMTLLVLSTTIPAQASAEDAIYHEQQSVFQDIYSPKHDDSGSESHVQSKSEALLENILESDVTPERKNDRLNLNKPNIFFIDQSAIASPETIVEANTSAVTSANATIESIDKPFSNLSQKRRETLIKSSIPHSHPFGEASYTRKEGRGVRSGQQLNEVLYQQVFTSSKFEFSQLEQKQTEQNQLESDKRNSQVVDNAPEPVLENPKPEEILEQLDKLPNTGIPLPPQDRGYLSSPGITVSNPNGYGADSNTLFAVADFQKRTRFGNTSDGELAFGIGLGNAVKFVGAELTYTLNSLGTSQDLGSGAFSIKLHRRIAEDLAVAIGWNQFADVYIGERRVDFDYPKNSYYAVVTKVFKTKEFINEPFSRVAVTAGIGSGQFLPFDTIRQAVSLGEKPTGLNVFGSIAVRIFEPVSAIVEWTGQDLGVGLSIVPFKNLPFVITPAFRDIAGAGDGDGARFIMGAGVSLRL